ncbi:DinB family protein [Sinomicrobium soli]|uniref:DinB family protein n=1 Tax=Sinomicrobium sp. N-1-3-6 TaxID=2219864 RepID=UPI000DCD38B4|nr:DinB family protein [Sinomicrobium sp. N-1-3-6]RAV29278.1 DinB family protein [Sinomicrobium sp. N-1-3-6]
MNSRELEDREYQYYYQKYILRLEETSLMEAFKNTEHEFVNHVKALDREKLLYRYAEDKWTVAEVIQHVIDTERIFTYRALRIARNDATDLPGYEQDEYVPFSGANDRSTKELLVDFKAARLSTVSLFHSFTDTMLLRTGSVSGNHISVRAIGFIISGHLDHHLNILRERYSV